MNDLNTGSTDSSTPPAETTNSNPAVSKPFVTAKPYDDDMFEAYQDENKEETKEPNETKTPEKTEPAKETKTPEEEKAVEAKPTIEDTVLKRTVNGKEVEFKVADAIKAWEVKEKFNRDMDRRVTVVSQREKVFERDQASLKGHLDKVIEVSQKGDFVTAIRALAKLATNGTDLDVTKFEKQYFDQLEKVRDVYTKMTPEQKEAYFAKRSQVDAEEKLKRFEEEKAQQTAHSQLQSKVVELQQQNSLSDEEFWGNYKALESLLVGDGKPFKTPQDITAEEVVKYSLQVRHEAKVLEAGKKAGIEDEAVLEELSEITQSKPDLTIDDLVRIIESSGIAKTASPEAVENLNRKAGKSKLQFNQANSAKKQNGKIEGLDKEDLDFLYRKQPRVFTRPLR